MRICYVSHANEHFTAPYVDYFSAQGHEVHLVSLHRQSLPNAVNHHPLRGSFDPEAQKLGYLWAIPKVRRIIRRISPDLVHAHYLTSNGVLAALSGCHPLVVTAHGSDVYQSLHQWLRGMALRYALKRADLVNPVSRDLQRKMLWLGVPSDKIVCLTVGIDVKRFVVDRTTRRPGPVRMICTRKLFPVYQCERIIPALATLAQRDIEFEFTFAATGDQEAELRELIRSNNLDDRVRCLGGYRLDDLPEMLADADMYVSASAWDGTSLSLLEALASGAFPVVSDIPANREWLTGDGDGLLFAPDSDDQLADCLARAIDDPRLRRNALERNRRRVARDGDRATSMSRLAEHYERLVRQKR